MTADGEFGYRLCMALAAWCLWLGAWVLRSAATYALLDSVWAAWSAPPSVAFLGVAGAFAAYGGARLLDWARRVGLDARRTTD